MLACEKEMPMSTESKKTSFPWTTATWLIIALVSVALWIIASQGSLRRGVLLVGLSLSSFMVGCLIGFLFTSYGEEIGTVGKVRDWLIGGIAGLTIGKADAVKGLLNKFTIGQGDGEFALMASAAIFYVGLGFFFMFFQRELILNVVLAEKRSERLRSEGSREAGQVIQRFLVRLPASMLSGVDDIDEIGDVKKDEAEALEKLLYSDDVNDFLQGADGASKGGSLDWDITSKTAYIYYYRTYFEKEDENKHLEVDTAIEWMTRALNMNPLHVDLTMKYADMLGANDEYEAAVVILERLVLRPEAPVLVKKWLGYFLLYLPNRERDSIRYSEDYLKEFPDDADARFNIACAYAQMYCDELKAAKHSTDPKSENRRKALEFLQEGLTHDPDFADTVKTDWTEKDESFDCLAADPDFQQLVGSRQVAPSPSDSRTVDGS
jgi:tetratricopeptide (TPR) repeat protein